MLNRHPSSPAEPDHRESSAASDEQYRQASDQSLYDSLDAVAAGVAVIYLLTIGMLLNRSRIAANPMLLVLQMAPALTAAAVAVGVRMRWIRPPWAHAAAMAIAAAVAFDIIVSMWLWPWSMESVHAMLLILALGMFLYCLRWWIVATTAVVSTWLITALLIDPDANWLEYRYGMIGAVAMSGALLISRRRALRRLVAERMRREDRERMLGQTVVSLRESENRQSLILDSLPMAIYTAELRDGQTKTLSVSPQIARISGFKPECFTGDPQFWDSRLHPDDREQTRRTLENFSELGAVEMEYRWRCADGQYRWFLDQPTLIRDETDQHTATVGIWLNINERKQSEIAHADSEQRYRSLFHELPIPLIQEDLSQVKQYLDDLRRDGVEDWQSYFDAHPQQVIACAGLVRIIEVNDRALQFYGAESVDALRNDLPTLLGEEGLAIFQKELITFAQGHTVFEHEATNRTLQGRKLHILVEISIAPRHESTWDKVIATSVDLTERKQAEQALRDSEDRQLQILETVPVAYYTLTVTGREHRYSWFSEHWERVTGCPPERFFKEDLIWSKRIHPDDYDRVRALEASVLDEGSTHMEYRWKHGNGEYRWFHEHMVLVQDDEDQPSEIRGVLMDVHERRQAQQTVQAIVDATTVPSGEDVFATLAQELARHLDVPYLIICEHLDHPLTRIRTLAFWNSDHLQSNMQFTAAGTPCGEMGSGDWTFCPSGVQAMFPDDQHLVDMGAESYCGIPLFNSDRRQIGHLAILDTRAMDENLYDLPTLQVFVTRAAAEMERRQAQRALQLTQFSVERTREPVYWVAPDGRFIYVNESACRELEYDRTTLLRMSVFDINPGLTETAWNERWRKLKQQGSIQFETRHLRKDGSILPVEIIGNYTHPINLWPTSM